MRKLGTGPHGLPRRARRGVALIITVIIGVFAVTASALFVYRSVVTTQQSAAERNQAKAQDLVTQELHAFAADLHADPKFYLSRVLPNERPRICPGAGPADGNLVVFPPASTGQNSDWPIRQCGATWRYPDGGVVSYGETTWDPESHTVEVEIAPPSAASPLLTVRIAATVAGQFRGVAAQFAPDGTALTGYAAGTLGMRATPGSGTRVSLSGTWYAGDTMLLAGLSGPTDAKLLAENGFVGPPPAGATLYTQNPQAGQHNIRALLPDRLTAAGLKSTYGRLSAAAGCSAPTGTLTEAGVTYARSVCLVAGQTLEDATGTSVTVPSGTDAYLLMFTGTTQEPTVGVYRASGPPPTIGDCLGACDVYELARADFTAGLSPASPPSGPAGLWVKLGTFPMPISGVLVADADIYVGQCPASLGTAAQGCGPSVPLANLTVLAGTPESPADVIIGAPIETAAALGLVATGSVVVPFYSHPKGQDLSVDAHLVSLGYGWQAAPAIRAVPGHPLTGPAATIGATLALTGGVAGLDVNLALPGWADVVLSPGDQRPPWVPGFTGAWNLTSSVPLTAPQVCGKVSCQGL